MSLLKKDIHQDGIVVPSRIGSSTTLSLIALALWIASLAFPALMFFPEKRVIYGYEILGGGWAGIFVLNIAWFANVLFWWTFFEISLKKVATNRALLTFLIALDAFLFFKMPYPFAVGLSPVYGYGWGAVFWLISICVLVAAAGSLETKKREVASIALGNKSELGGGKLLALGIFLSFIFFALAAFWAYHDHSRGNEMEKERLSGLAFKKRAVCKDSTVEISKPVLNRLGALTVINLNKEVSPDPFHRAEKIVQWGIPVRVAGKDIQRIREGEDSFLKVSPAVGEAAATLYVSATATNGVVTQTSAKMVEAISDRLVFDQTWRMEPGGGMFCPDFSPDPNPGEQPRKLLLAAYGIADNVDQSTPTGFDGAIKGKKYVAAKLQTETAGVGALPGISKEGKASMALLNQNCPSDVGWNGEDAPVDLEMLFSGRAFRIGSRNYYLGSRDRQYAYCADGHVFLTEPYNAGGQIYVHIQKRALIDFKLIWTSTISVAVPSARTSNVMVKSVEEEGDSVSVRIVNLVNQTESVLYAESRKIDLK